MQSVDVMRVWSLKLRVKDGDFGMAFGGLEPPFSVGALWFRLRHKSLTATVVARGMCP